jgi:uncharacterized protein YoxC
MAALQRRWTETVTAVVAILFLLVTLYGVNGTVNKLEVKVNEFEQKTEELEDVQSQIDVLQKQAGELRTFRDDILEAVCIQVADTPGELRACRRSSSVIGGR